VAASTNYKISGILAALTALAVMLLLTRREAVERVATLDHTATAQHREPTGLERVTLKSFRVRRPSIPVTTNARGDAPPRNLEIDEITVEKDEVCEGEENLVTVSAHVVNGVDSFLHFVIGGERGPMVPVRTYLLPDGSPVRHTISVFGKDGESVSVEVPRYRVKDCRPERTVVVRCGGMANATDVLTFMANVVESGSARAAFHPVRVDWDFGDSTNATTTEHQVSHSYARRRQESLYSTYLIEAKMSDEYGNTVSGRMSLELLNLAYQDLAKFGIVAISAQGTPRFPVLNSDGKVRQTFELWHHYPVPINIQHVRGLRMEPDGSRHDDGEIVELSRLSQTLIPVGDNVSIELVFDALRNPNSVGSVYQFEGTALDGRPASGLISVMRPPPKPTRTNTIPVQDPVLADRIRRAMKVFGKDAVTQEELWQLESMEGAESPVRR
jgi:hypothetical protein